MKGKITHGGLAVMAVVLISLWATFLATEHSETFASEEPLITVLNPEISSQYVERVPLAPRADTLEGKTIYLVDLQWGGPQAGYSVFEEIQKWFAKNKPSVKVELRRSKGGWMGSDPELIEEIAEKKAAGVLIGIGG